MIILRGCKPGPLDECEETIRSLSDLFGDSAWGGHREGRRHHARAEGWERRRRSVEEDLARNVFRGPTMPWGAVIRESAQNKVCWQEHVKDLARLVPRAAGAAASGVHATAPSRSA